jgi:hypothetical protein
MSEQVILDLLRAADKPLSAAEMYGMDRSGAFENSRDVAKSLSNMMNRKNPLLSRQQRAGGNGRDVFFYSIKSEDEPEAEPEQINIPKLEPDLNLANELLHKQLDEAHDTIDRCHEQATQANAEIKKFLIGRGMPSYELLLENVKGLIAAYLSVAEKNASLHDELAQAQNDKIDALADLSEARQSIAPAGRYVIVMGDIDYEPEMSLSTMKEEAEKRIMEELIKHPEHGSAHTALLLNSYKIGLISS